MKNREKIILGILALGSLLIRLMLVSKGPFSHESLNLALKAEITLATHQLQFIYGTGYPLMMLITSGFILFAKLFNIQDPVLASNLLSVIGSAFTIPVFYILVRKMFDQTTALLSAVMLSVCPIFLAVSVYGYGHSYELIFLFSGMLFIFRFRDTRRTLDLILSAVWLGLMGATRIQDLMLAMPAVYFLLFVSVRLPNELSHDREKIRMGIKNLFIFSGIIVLVIVLFHCPYLLGKNRQAYIEQYLSFKNASFSAEHQQNFFHSFPFYKQWFIQSFSVIGVVAFLLGILTVLFINWRTGVFCILWLMVPLLFFLKIDTTIPRLFVILLPPMIMLICNLFARYLKKETILMRGLSAGTFLVVLYLMFMEIYPVLKYRHEHALLPEYVQWVKKNTPVNTQMILMDDYLFFKHYGRFEVLPRPVPAGEKTKKQMEEFKTKIDRMLAAKVPVYTTGTGLYSYNPGNEFSNFMKTNYTVEEVGSYLYEDYHSGELVNAVFKNHLIRISFKTDQMN
ncbi:MAG: glycosyltransferase family 39 protein [Candidatus Omnitrophota bacterium]